jgi:hypothetical protein
MDDLYCPACRLVLFAPAVGTSAPHHCPRCATKALRIELRRRTPRASLVRFYNASLAGRQPRAPRLPGYDSARTAT